MSTSDKVRRIGILVKVLVVLLVLISLILVTSSTSTVRAQSQGSEWAGTYVGSEIPIKGGPTLSIESTFTLDVSPSGPVTGSGSGEIVFYQTYPNCTPLTFSFSVDYSLDGNSSNGRAAWLFQATDESLLTDKTFTCKNPDGSIAYSMPAVEYLSNNKLTTKQVLGTFALYWNYGALVSLEGGYSDSESVSAGVGSYTVTIEGRGPSPETTLTGPQMSVACKPIPQQVGNSVTCLASVFLSQYSVSTPEIIDWTSTSAAGQFSRGLSIISACVLGVDPDVPFNACTIDYTDGEVGNNTIVATYEGDSSNPMAAVSTTVAFRLQGNVGVWCRSRVGTVGIPEVCVAMVGGTAAGVYPTGAVMLGTAGEGSSVFPLQCSIGRVSGTVGPFKLSSINGCIFEVSASRNGTIRLAIDYRGDSYYMPSGVVANLSFVDSPKTRLSLKCTGASSQACTATVVGGGTVATGTVSWNSTSGSFQTSTCSLTVTGCEVSYTPAGTSATITAYYGGDSMHAPSQAAVTIFFVAGERDVVSQTLQTGVNITLSGFSSSFPVYVYTEDYPSQPDGTGNPPYTDARYFDVEVSGASAGSAYVCYYDPMASANSGMRYYSNNAWVNVTNLSVVPGNSVCGDVPISALAGTPAAVGTVSTGSGYAESSSNSGGGIPEFPFQLLVATAFASLITLSYLLFRRKRPS